MKKQSEQMMKLVEEITSLGFPLWSFGNLDNVLPEDLQPLKYGISVAVPVSNRIFNEVERRDSPTHTYFHRYRTINAFIDQGMLKLSLLLEGWGYETFAIPASQSVNDGRGQYRGIFQHRTVATRCGLGWIGKSGNLVTDQFGPRVRLGSILTDMPLPDNGALNEEKCGDCIVCVDRCPALALSGEPWSTRQKTRIYDPKACSDHMKNHYKNIGRGSVCGICIAVCPKGKS